MDFGLFHHVECRVTSETKCPGTLSIAAEVPEEAAYAQN